MKKTKVKTVTHAAIIAALYIVLTFIANSLGLASGVIQVRLSEALTILPAFTTAAIPGLFIGCLLSNILTGGVIWDMIFGSIATLIGAVGTYALKKYKWLTPLPPILANAIIVPFVLIYAYGVTDALPYLMFTVGAGEVVSAGVLGMLIHNSLIKHKNIFD